MTTLKDFVTPVPESAPGKSRYQPQYHRRILYIFPKYSRSFGTFHYAYRLMGQVKAFMPPQGILVVAAYIDQQIQRPPEQIRWETQERLPLTEFPIPAYHLINLDHYFIANIQFSSGCPYRCEFCDIPELYGRNPRMKTPEQVTAELDAMLRSGNPGAVYFVDDNFVGNRSDLCHEWPGIAWPEGNHPFQ